MKEFLKEDPFTISLTGFLLLVTTGGLLNAPAILYPGLWDMVCLYYWGLFWYNKGFP